MDCREIIVRCIERGDVVVPELDAQKICAEYGIVCPPSALATDKGQCAQIAAEIGYPVVMKIVSPQVIHKSDVGGVVTGIANEAQLEAAYEQIVQNVKQKCPEAHIEGILVQKQAPKGTEVVVGALRNEQFGPVVMFGMGGIYIEVFKDVAFRLAPLERDEALRMIESTKVSEILKGARGGTVCDIEALADLIVNTAKLVSDYPEVAELDFNPVFCYPEGCVAVDARIIPKK